MLQVITTIIKALWPILRMIIPNLSMSPVGGNLATLGFAKIKDLVETKELPLSESKSKLLPIERINQYKIKESNNEYACFFTSYVMQLSYMSGKKLVPEQFDDVCKNAKVINDKFRILAGGHEKIYVCAGLPQYTSLYLAVTKSSQLEVLRRVIASINADLPCIVSLDGNHFQLVNGYEYRNDELLLNIVDPGGWVDTHLETSTMRVFKFKGEQRIYSQYKGVHRVGTSFRLPVKA